MKIPQSLFKFVWHYLKQQPVAFGYIVITSWVWAINESIFPYLIKLIINTVSGFQGDRLHIYTALRGPLTVIVIAWVVMEFSMRSQGFVILNAFPKLRATIRQTVFSYVRQHSHQYFMDNFAGSIANKISDLPSSTERIIEILIFNIIALAVSFIVALGLLWHANIVFFLIMATWATIHISIGFVFLRSGNRLSKVHAESVTTLSGKIVDSITNILNVRLFASGAYESRYLGRFQADEIAKSKQAIWHLEKMKMIQGMTGITFILSMVFTLIYGWTHYWVTLGDFTLVTMLSFNMLGFIWFISYQMTVLVREAGKINSALRLISVPHGVQDQPDAKLLEVTQGAIQFDHATFSYQSGRPVFDALSVSIAPGQHVGLVGFSGSGKSTFVNLLLRFYDIQQGEILIDQQNIAAVTRDSLRQHISMIPQDPSLFHRTLMENIRYGRPDASDDAVKQAAKHAHCDEFIAQLDQEYESLVGERGIKLSGGQRQRIAIARAMLKGAPILILDEATSSLDSVTEHLIQQSLEELMQSRTTIVIAHRLSTLQNMDRILVFDQGSIIEDGTVPELLQKKGHFAKLWKMQTDGFLPD